MAGLRNTLQIRATQTQSQILTPQMQQAIRLLQLSTIELQQQIRQTVDSNPMLELDDSDMSSIEESYEDMLESENQNDSDYDPFSDDSSVNNASIDDEKSLLDILGDGSINLDTKKITKMRFMIQSMNMILIIIQNRILQKIISILTKIVLYKVILKQKKISIQQK